METERPSPRYADIDAWDAADILDAMVEGQFTAVAAVRAQRGAVERAAVAVEGRLRASGRLTYAGSGTSGRLAAQDGAELTPTFGWPADRVLILIAGGHEALLKAVEGAEDDTAEAARLIDKNGIGERDVLIAVAASGTTPFTLACMMEARERGALTVGIANNADTPLLNGADHAIWLDTGPEVIAGSTRMKAGTAQRIALGALSSLVMIRLGRVYCGLMVDVQASNAKLVRRSEAMLGQLTGREPDAIRRALGQAQGRVKLAALLLHGLTPPEAEAALERAGGHLRAALSEIDGTGRDAPPRAK